MAIVTISRGTMSGGRKLAEMLAARTGFRCLSREIVIKASDEYGLPESKLFEAIQKSPSLFQKLTYERESYLASIQAALCEYAMGDNLIYHGHAGHFLLEGIAHVFRIRILADMPYRIKAAMEQFNFSTREAEKYIQRIDKERLKWTQFLYGRDWRSPELYDVVFNIGHVDLDFVCDMVVHALEHPRFQATPLSVKALQDLLTGSRLRAKLARTAGVRLERLDIRADGGYVLIQGKVKSQRLIEEILKAASEVPGVEHVEDKMQIDYRSYGIE